jgi:hemolysin activation/secretion protein
MASAALCAAVPQAPVNTGDILRQVEPVKLPMEEKTIPFFIPSDSNISTQQPQQPTIRQETEKVKSTFFVKGFNFNGNTAFDSKTLSERVKSYEEKEYSVDTLKQVASIITKYYRDNGYFVARAYIPAQTMENGIVKIAVIEGSYNAFELRNTSHVDTKEVQGFMDHLKQGQIVSSMSLERQMLLINDLSGAQVTNAEVYPGAAVGTSDFRITVSPTPKYTGYVIADNYGSRYTGENRLSVGANINSLTGIGDTFSLAGLISNTADLKNIRLGYDRPLGYNGLKGGLSASTTQYTLSEITNYEGYGQTNSYNAYVAYPILKTRAHTQSVQLDYDHKDMKDTNGATGLATESQKSIDALTLKGSDKRNTSLLNLPGSLNASLGYTLGHLGLDNANAQATDNAGLHAGGNYTKLTLNAIQSQYLVEDTTLQTTFKAQKSFGHNLDSSEDLSVGGSNGVRAYEDSELSGDAGYALSLDLIYTLPKVDQVTHNTSIFFDHARIWKNTTLFNTEDNIRNLNALGVGYSLSYQNFDLKATLAHGFGSESTPTTEADISTNRNKFLVQGMMRF